MQVLYTPIHNRSCANVITLCVSFRHKRGNTNQGLSKKPCQCNCDRGGLIEYARIGLHLITAAG